MQCTDYAKVRQLAKDILVEYKQMALLSGGLQNKLKVLEGTFLDDGIDQVKDYTTRLINGLVSAQNAFFSVANELTEYARLLEAGKGKASAHLERSDLYSSTFVAQSLPSNPVVNNNATLAPTRNKPRDLSGVGTQFEMVKDSDGNLVYDSPIETDQYLYKNQGSADPDFQGTCGLCSCANILRLSGVNATEAQMLAYASTTNNPNTLFQKLCATGYTDPGMNGGTSPKSRQYILQNFGIDSGIFPMEREKDGSLSDSNLTTISKNVSEGRGVILSVHADILWNDAPVGVDDYHAVTVTSVKKDSTGNILGFFICDSANSGTAYYSADKVKRALTGSPMNVTYSIVR